MWRIGQDDWNPLYLPSIPCQFCACVERPLMVSDSLSAKPKVLALGVLISAMVMAFRWLRHGKVCGCVKRWKKNITEKWFHVVPKGGFALLSQVGCCLGGFSGLLCNRPRGCEHAVGWWKNLNLHSKLFIQAIDFQAFTAQIQKHVILAEGNPTPNDWKSFRETQLWPPTASEDPLPTLRRPWRPAWPPSVLPATSWQSWKRWTVGNDDWPGQPTRFCWLLQHPCKVNRLNRLCSADLEIVEEICELAD